MGIETRKNDNSYYYRKRRKNGRIVSEYVGSGAIGALYATLDAERRADQAQDRTAQRAQLAAWTTEERDARALERDAAQIAALTLLAAGYYQHKRQWRKRRTTMRPTERLIMNLKAENQAEVLRRAQTRTATLPTLPAPDDNTAAARALMDRCNRSDASAADLAALRALIVAQPSVAAVVSPFAQLLDQQFDKIGNVLVRELRRGRAAEQRAVLGYADAPALERPLIDHLLLCEERLAEAERYHTAVHSLEQTPLKYVAFGEARLSAAQGRYLRAVETLARVRRVRVALARLLPDGSAQSVEIDSPGM